MESTAQYSEKFRAYSYDGDAFYNLQPGAILRFAQQVAIDQCTRFGLDTAFYQRTHTAFLMARQTLVFQAPVPAAGPRPSGSCGGSRRSFGRCSGPSGWNTRSWT